MRLPLVSLTLGLVVAGGPAGAQTSFTDTFNRVDPNGLGGDWSAANGGQSRTDGDKVRISTGTNNIYLVNPGVLSGAVVGMTARVDVSSAGSTGFQYVALALGYSQASPTGTGIYVKVAATDATGLFNRVDFYTGVNTSSTVPWAVPANTATAPWFAVNSAAATPFTTARVTARIVDANTVRLGIDSDFDGTDDQVFTRDFNPAAVAFGSQAGLGMNGLAMRADNFVLTVTPVPEPTTGALVFAIAAVALVRSRLACAR